MSGSPSASVIICTYDEKRLKDLDECINSILGQRYDNFEILVVVDHNESLYRKLVSGYRGLGVKVILNKSARGQAASMNCGLLNAKGDIVCFIDDDAIAPEGWIERIQKGGGRRGLHVFGGPAIPIYRPGLKPPPWWDDRVLGRYLAICNRAIVGCNFVVRRETFELLGEFRPYLGRYGGKLISNEEVEFTLRAYLAGLKVGFDYGLIVYHKVRPGKLTMPYLLKRAWLQGLSTYLTVRKDLRLALLGRELMASKCPCEGIREPIKISARMMNTLLIAITFLSYLYCFARYTIIGHPISATASQDAPKSLLR